MPKLIPNSLLYPLNTLKKIRDNFVKELSDASLGKKTSLFFLKNPIPHSSLAHDGEIFQVMVVGGRLFEKALIKKYGNKIIILFHLKDKLPIFDTAQDFFSFFEKQLESKIKAVALNFAYGLKPILRKNLLDGKLTTISKEQPFKGLINKIVGEEIEKYIFQKQKRQIKISVANDTICLLLSVPRSFNRYLLAAGVVGAGTNFAFFLDEETAVNLESNNFDKFPATATGQFIDKNSTHPGQHLFEKEVSGAYLFQHYNLLIEKSYLDNDRSQDKLFIQRISSTLALNKIAKNSKHSGSILAQKLLERSASLIACQIAEIYEFKKLKTVRFWVELNWWYNIKNYESPLSLHVSSLGQWLRCLAKKAYRPVKTKVC